MLDFKLLINDFLIWVDSLLFAYEDRLTNGFSPFLFDKLPSCLCARNIPEDKKHKSGFNGNDIKFCSFNLDKNYIHLNIAFANDNLVVAL